LIIGTGDREHCISHKDFSQVPHHPILANMITPFVLNAAGVVASGEPEHCVRGFGYNDVPRR
ncbi:MAG: hypothetical protein ACREHG_01480, partial [Candidatus Saccharimonadales bacterium]